MTKLWKTLPALHILLNLMSMSSFMAKWERQFFHNYRNKVNNQKKIPNKLMYREDEDGIHVYFKERARLNELLLHEEVYWKQKAKTSWLKEGDANTNFFHAQVSKMKRLKNISYLVTEDGEKVENHEQLCTMTKVYFQGVVSKLSNVNILTPIAEHPLIIKLKNNALTVELSFEDVAQ